MSRCVRFPPKGYVWNGASGVALLELLQARIEEAASEKRRKKEDKRRRKKKENEELEEGEIRESVCGRHKKHKKGKKCDHENQLLLLELERSSLTEEHEQPIICDHNSLYDSSDNTENVRPKFAIQENFALPAASSSESCLQHKESQFAELFVHCVPSLIQIDHYDGQDWLFERNLPRRNPTAVSSACNDGNDSCLESSSSYPCPRYLPQVDILALPYTLLF